jgi:hypothetical protein
MSSVIPDTIVDRKQYNARGNRARSRERGEVNGNQRPHRLDREGACGTRHDLSIDRDDTAARDQRRELA